MPSPKKKNVRSPVVTPERMLAAFHHYPKLTLTGLATIIGIITAIGPFVLTWYNDFVRHAEFNDYKTSTLRSDLWRDVRASQVEATLARNRLNDCNLLRERKQGLTALEKAVCKQYEDELDAANKRINVARDAAMALSKEK